MAAHAYYAKENARHSDVKNTPVTCGELQRIADSVVNHFGYPGIIMVTMKKDRKNCGAWSYFRPGGGMMTIHGYVLPKVIETRNRWGEVTKVEPRPLFDRIEMSPSMMNLKTLAHELAHCLHYREYRKAHAGKTVGENQRAHSEHHVKWMDRVVDFMKSEGFVKSVPVNPLLAQIKAAAEVFVKTPLPSFPKPVREDGKVPMDSPDNYPGATKAEAWWDELPEQQLCTKCNHTQHKDEFGMRTVSPGKFARQGYCRTCRKTYYQNKKLAR